MIFYTLITQSKISSSSTTHPVVPPLLTIPFALCEKSSLDYYANIIIVKLIDNADVRDELNLIFLAFLDPSTFFFLHARKHDGDSSESENDDNKRKDKKKYEKLSLDDERF